MATPRPVKPTTEAGLIDRWPSLRPEVTDALLADITRRIVEKFYPYKIILFGSYAWGTPHRDSDVDLFVLMDSNEDMFTRMAQVEETAEVPFLPMDMLAFTPAELQARLDIGDPFYRTILSRGRVLYERAAS